MVRDNERTDNSPSMVMIGVGCGVGALLLCICMCCIYARQDMAKEAANL